MPQPAYTTGFRLPPDMRQTLDALAAAEGRSFGNLVRALLRAELERRGVYSNPPPALHEPALNESAQR